MELIKKVVFRLFRIFTFRKGIYGKLGRHNKFKGGVFITEYANIGNHNYFAHYSMVSNAIIGNYCSIGPGTKIGQETHSKNYITTCQKISKELIGFSMLTKPAIIGNDVWCGAGTSIMQGVKIGDGAIVGANAVVTRDVPDYAIVAGVPAKVIGYRFEPEVIELIKKSEWYNYDLTRAKEIIKTLERDCIPVAVQLKNSP